ncbi:MAG: hypothetical protein A2X61_02600 [Ignavibacteria bacterium GWB2_35_12]|nr:MAG: hypothetical protein A2X63_11350 [Ignavibacteria bacterium GWA2_35_8]OGU42467.1 MAG: hypothetical protein A2X61_02600 [Ignavibacteria bacterium GWB2_35_12]OGU96636.1 MAG: hypothetical protein A2220_12180 [Ignavibacteria bacterium RIFOXYA2_FULL_35_10]OGV24247.1 MAG: hypothetical protein A2475_08525 [Ignavibacteria bacterium RIFOXYC2_FULL_35_21]
MGKDNINTDFLVKNILRKSSIHEPSGDFTNNVMTQISAMKPVWAIEYKPIISRKAWFLLVTFVVLSITLIILAVSVSSGEGASQFTIARDFEMLTNTFGLYLKSFFSGIKIPILIPLGLGFVLFALLIEPFFRKVFKIKNPV